MNPTRIPYFAPTRRRIVQLVLLVGALAAAALAARQGLGQKLAAPAPAAVPVSMELSARRDLPIWLNTIGSVQPLNSVDVRVRVDGQLTRIAFAEGQQVHAGDVLAEIDPRPYQTLLAQARAGKARDEAQLANVQMDLDRAEKLAAAGAGPTQAADTLRAQQATLKASLQADQAAVDSAQLQLSFTRVTSPIDGRTGQRLLNAGAMVHASDATGLVTVTQFNPISILFSLPQDDLAEVVHESTRGPLKVVAMTRDGARRIATGKLSFIDNKVSASNGQVQFKASFDNAGGELWPGALVAVRVLLRTEPDAIVVPTTAVQQAQQGSFVYVVKPDETVERRAVDVGATVGAQQWVRKGLVAGETVVTQGQFRLAPGLKVARLTAAAPAASSADAGVVQ